MAFSTVVKRLTLQRQFELRDHLTHTSTSFEASWHIPGQDPKFSCPTFGLAQWFLKRTFSLDCKTITQALTNEIIADFDTTLLFIVNI